MMEDHTDDDDDDDDDDDVTHDQRGVVGKIRLFTVDELVSFKMSDGMCIQFTCIRMNI